MKRTMSLTAIGRNLRVRHREFPTVNVKLGGSPAWQTLCRRYRRGLVAAAVGGWLQTSEGSSAELQDRPSSVRSHKNKEDIGTNIANQ